MSVWNKRLGLDVPPAVILVWGADHHQRQEGVLAVRQAIFGEGAEGMEAFNYERFEGPYTASFSDIQRACHQAPMMVSRRLVELSGPEELGAQLRGKAAGEGGAKMSAAQAVEALLAYLEAPVDSTVLLLHSANLQGTSKLVKAIKKSAQAVEYRCELQKEADAAAMLVKLARARGLSLASGAAAEVIARVGTATAAWMDALDKLEAQLKEPPASQDGTGAGGSVQRGPSKVDRALVEREILRSTDENVFSLTDAVGRRDAAQALEILGRFYAQGEKGLDTAMRLSAMLLWQTRRLLAVAAKASPEDLGIKPFVFNKLRPQAQAIGVNRLMKMHRALLRLDQDLKGGSSLAYASPLISLQRWVLEACDALPGVPPRRGLR